MVGQWYFLYHDVSRTVREAKDHMKIERVMDVNDRMVFDII